MKIVILDGGQLNPGDLSWKGIEQLGNVEIYPTTNSEEIVSRSLNAEVVITNKVPFTSETIASLPNLKCIIVSATGYNIIDVKSAKNHGIVVCNSPDYSTESVAQHVFALVLGIMNRVECYTSEVKQGKWAEVNDWSYTNEPLTNLYQKTLGILGFGQIGQLVGKIGRVFGMQVLAHHRHPERDATPGVEFVSLEDLFKSSDVLSLHVPLNDSTHHIVNADRLSQMREESILINTGRGPLIDEDALYQSLKRKQIRAAGLDVMQQEPPNEQHKLYELENCFLTPHIAWAGVYARKKLMGILEQNIRAFQNNLPINRVG